MAIQALLVILAVLLVLLFLGVPISYAIAVSSLTAILSSIDLNVAVLTAAQRTFVFSMKFTRKAFMTPTVTVSVILTVSSKNSTM